MSKLLSREAVLSLGDIPADVKAERKRMMDEFEAKRAAASQDAADAGFKPFMGRADWFIEHVGMAKVPDLLEILRGMTPNISARVVDLLDARYRRDQIEAEKRRADVAAAARVKRQTELDAGAL